MHKNDPQKPHTPHASHTHDAAHPDKKRKSPRRKARELVMQGLYQHAVGGADEAAIETHLHELQSESDHTQLDRNFFLALLHGVLKEADNLKEQLQPHLDRPFIDLSPVEASVLLIGAYELKNCPETPYRVIINEGIELAKTFGGTEGHRYINGVLDKLAAQLRTVEIGAQPRNKR